MKKTITNKITHIILALSACVIIFTAIGQGDDMFSWFRKKKEVFLSPEVNGIVTENGQPIANLEIIRSLMYLDEIDRRDTAMALLIKCSSLINSLNLLIFRQTKGVDLI